MTSILPVVHLELDSGTFKIKTNDAIYLIEVSPNGAPVPVLSSVPALTGAQPVDDYYQELSEEMFDEIGKLARQLSLSIREIPNEAIEEMDLEGTGVQLEDAKGQLEDIVKLTEKATMDIMDLTESILGDCQSVHEQLENVINLDFVKQETEEAGDADPDEGADAKAEPKPNPELELFTSLLEKEESLRSMIDGISTEAPAPVQAAPPPTAEPVVKKVTEYQFDIKVIFQTLYELCTNEKVKSHIKAMGEESESIFDNAAVLAAMAELAPNVDVEDNFFEFPINEILKSLHGACSDERYKQILVKINQTMDGLFLDTMLPIEGSVEEKEITVEPEAPAPAAEAPAGVDPFLSEEIKQRVLAAIDENIQTFTQEKERLSDEDIFGKDEPSQPSDSDFTIVKNKDRELIIASIEQSHQILQGIIPHIMRILEALSFQDLSGQRIMKIVHLLSHAQVQLLRLLVSFGTKIKQKKEGGDVTVIESTELAQEEVDSVFEKIATRPLEGPDGSNSLDQDAVDGMLADMGF